MTRTGRKFLAPDGKIHIYYPVMGSFSKREDAKTYGKKAQKDQKRINKKLYFKVIDASDSFGKMYVIYMWSNDVDFMRGFKRR